MTKIRTYNDWAKEIISNYGTKGGEKMIKALQEELQEIKPTEKEESEKCEPDSER